MKNLDLVGMLITAFKLVGEQPVVDLLQQLYTKNPSFYGLVIAALNFGLSEGQIAALKTAGTIDDQIVSTLKAVVKASADKNNFPLL